MLRPLFSTLACLGIFLGCASVIGQGPDDTVDRARIAAVVKTISTRDRNRIAHLIQYPLERGYPVKSIRSPQECAKRFEEVFDEAFLSEIAASNLSEDWQRVGWRGILFKAGSLWLDDDYRISGINHETEKGEAVRARIIAKDKSRLPLELRDFDRPELEWMTKSHIIRVDKKGDDFRLLVFKRGSKSHPLLNLSHGVYELHGQLGDFQISWK